MLTELFVENFALMEKVQVNFQIGLNVLTGETGAGKSLIIDAVGLLTGGRASLEMVRSGAEKAMISGTFLGPFAPEILSRLEESGLDGEDDLIILSREIMTSGKNTCRVNCRVVPLALFRDLARRLVNIHGQHEQVALLDEDNQLQLLDNYGGGNLAQEKEKVRVSFLSLEKLNRRLAEITAAGRDSEQRKEFLSFQLREINQAKLNPAEEEILQEEQKILQHTEKLSLDTTAAYEKLYGGRQNGAQDLIQDAAVIINNLSGIDKVLQPLGDRLNELGYLLDDLVREIGDYRENVVADPQRLDLVEKRLQEILKLKKKYGGSIPEILIYAEKAQRELAGLENSEENWRELEKAIAEETAVYQQLAAHLTELRRQAAEKLSQAVSGQLHQLQMMSAQFQVQVEPAVMSVRGQDRVIFMISPNLGEELKPVAKIASGGEMSRIMLGIKVILAELDQTPTLIFDEIDSGLGGRAVYAVGEKLSLISNYTQVFCVTHSPVTASFADNHLLIAKETESGRTRTRVSELAEEEIYQELSRMLAGDNATEITMAQAKELRAVGRRQN